MVQKLSSPQFFFARKMQHGSGSRRNADIDDIDTLLDSIAGSCKLSVSEQSIPTREERLFPPLLPLSLVEKVATSIYTNRSFPSTTPRGDYSHRDEGDMRLSKNVQCDDENVGVHSRRARRAEMGSSYVI